ncbi:polyhydroxyalkanoate depolymerase [Aquabacterium sp.]|uniref:polyhydroxyalkanoate depolymerase n=1 Tax=Aquabacterium sp. TaxID=1872578 RepID=UPI0035ADED6B
MLYQIYETNRAWLSPFSEFASATAKLFSNPLSPMAHIPQAQRMSAGYDLLHRLTKEYEKPEFEINHVNVQGTDVVIQEQVVVHKPFCRLLRFKRFTDNAELLSKMREQPSVLVVAPLSGHHSTLLRDTVRTLLQDHKVYITDWVDARMVPMEEGAFHLDDYVNYVQEFIRAVGPNVHVISVCQPTVPVLAAISLMASRGEQTPLSMTMMGGPIDARKSPTAVNNLAMNKSFEWFENNVIYRVPPNYPGATRRVYPGFLQHTGFVAMNPDRHATSHYDYFLDLVRGDGDSAEAHRQFYDEYNAVLDMPAEYYLDTIKTVFQDFALVNGTWQVRNPQGKPEFVRPQDIKTTALLTVEGELDDISGAGQTEAAHDLCSSIPKAHSQHYTVPGAGHYGIFAGRRWRDLAYPQVKAFIYAHNKPGTTQAQAPAPAPASVEPAAKVASKAASKTAPRSRAKVSTPAAE